MSGFKFGAYGSSLPMQTNITGGGGEGGGDYCCDYYCCQ